MKKLFVATVLFITGIPGILAQNGGDIFKDLESKSANEGSVHIAQSDNIKHVFYLHLLAARKVVRNNGWRICVFADSGQEANRKAENIRSIFISRFKAVRSYKIFNYPFYRVYVGDFRSKSEAMKFLKVLEREFPNAYIVPDVISQPGLN